MRWRRNKGKNYLQEPGTKKAVTMYRYNNIIAHCYYIIDLSNILKPRYIRRAFDSPKEARLIIGAFLWGDFERFHIEDGYTLAKYQIKAYGKYLKSRVRRNLMQMKYDYPEHCITGQQRKDFRTMSRRRLREKWNKKLGTN
jgi:hypothetical protein